MFYRLILVLTLATGCAPFRAALPHALDAVEAALRAELPHATGERAEQLRAALALLELRRAAVAARSAAADEGQTATCDGVLEDVEEQLAETLEGAK